MKNIGIVIPTAILVDRGTGGVEVGPVDDELVVFEETEVYERREVRMIPHVGSAVGRGSCRSRKVLTGG